MSSLFLVSPLAARDLAGIWLYLKKKGSRILADRVESDIRQKFSYLARFPGGGHYRRDLTSADVRFLAVYSYFIVYRPETKPLQIVRVVHGNRDLARILHKPVPR